ncbi:MAG: helix-turn-helix domain-containing protein [Patescibacteria group bacterium]|nr:helix-turn-helix domain-containing protein [Patescibacteria group bacterium]
MIEPDVRACQLRNEIGLLTESDLMLLLGITDHTLQSWRSNSIGPKYVKLGRTVMYRVIDVREWIDNNVQSGTMGTITSPFRNVIDRNAQDKSQPVA